MEDTDILFQLFGRQPHTMLTNIPDVCKYITYILHSPFWEANRFVANPEIPRILWNPKVHYRVQSAATCLYAEPAQSSPYTHIPIPEDPS
jgi:hypothetical protein